MAENTPGMQATGRGMRFLAPALTVTTVAMPFLGLSKACRKLGISFWNYLGAGSTCPARRRFLASPRSSAAAASRPDRGRNAA
jgi:hypothetical protein